MTHERVNYRATQNQLVTTMLVPTPDDFKIMQTAAARHSTIWLDALPAETEAQMRFAEKACIQAAVGQAHDRRSGMYLPVREEIVTSAVSRTLANGGFVVRLWADAFSRETMLPTVLNQFWDDVAHERRVRARQQYAARFAIMSRDK